MNLQTRRLTLQGPAGDLEALLDEPSGPCKGVAVISHPHPLFGGTMDNKVVQTLARAFVHSGWRAVRYNFRGVGASAGEYDEGRGEVEDLLAVVEQQAATGPLALAAFSFGAFVTTQAVVRLAESRPIDQLVLVGTAASRFQAAVIPQDLHPRTLVVHGEADDTVPLSAVMDWARPQTLPVLVVPGVGHFFHGQLPLLKTCVMRHLGA
jgi:alpha/beta superfamily hydrolase